MSYTIWVVSPPGNADTRCFEEAALALQSALGALGHEAAIVTDIAQAKGTVITLGANMLPLHNMQKQLPADAIIFNMEQAHLESWWFAPERGYLGLLRTHRVWDFSRKNIEVLKSLGINDIVYCGLGYVPELSRIEPAEKEDIDVLFVGRPHPRREHVIKQLRDQGVNVKVVGGLFGPERDKLIARSKVLLNIHMEKAHLFEMVRVSYWLANKKCVVSEVGTDAGLEKPLEKGVAFASYDRLAETCIHYLGNAAARKRKAQSGFKLFSAQSQVDFLQAALKEQSKTAQATIFVNIASYRDPQCQWTVKDLFEKATYPERINVGICWQYDPEADQECFVIDPPRPQQVRAVQYHIRDSQGAGWARGEAQKLWQGEDYTLQIQAHMRFEPGWDETLINLLQSCPSEKPVLTAWLPGYKPQQEVKAPAEVPLMVVNRIEWPDDAQMVHLIYRKMPAADMRGKIWPTGSWVGNFLFARSSMLKEVPSDPHIYFWGEEINYSARLWTHGYDFFHLDRVVLYHYWDRAEAKDAAQYRNNADRRNRLSLMRNLYLFGVKTAEDAEAVKELDKYPLGRARSLADYWEYVGYDLATRTISKKAREGGWTLPEKNAGKGTIFVNIASYRDPECQWTLKDLFAKAAHPERIRVGICQQADPVEDKACMVKPDRPEQVRITQVHYKDSQGANWARSEAQKLWNGEEYVLQIDSHIRFEPGWDDMLIGMLNRCPSEKSLISGYPPNYDPPDKRDYGNGQLLRIRVRRFGEEDDPQLLHITALYVDFGDRRAGLYPTPFGLAGFMFARASVFQEVPFDPHIHFYGDETSYAARLWTHGYDVFQPDRIVLFHYWVRKESLPLQHYRNTKTAKSKRTLERVRHLLGFETSSNPQVLAEIERYGLGSARRLEDLWTFAGIDWQQQTITQDALEGRWNILPPPLEGGGRGRGSLNEDPFSKISPHPGLPLKRGGRKSTIFVNIASYRDRECQWTVKDMFKKAANPDRINVGICWQFDEKEDKDCFEVSTRPDQVRVMPVDWRESEGVCWARHQTQQLWDGEDYNLQIDAHMRFVPGWDELMMKELELCESEKPVLSCTMGIYTPPDNIKPDPKPTIRRVRQFLPDGNIRGQGEYIDRVPEKPLNGAFVAAGFLFSKGDIVEEVPYDPYLYFDQEEIAYAARLYTHGWDVFSSRHAFMYHYYNDKPGGSVRPLHWKDLHEENKNRIAYLQKRGLGRFNHLTGHQVAQDENVTKELDKYGFGRARTLQQFEEYCGIDFKRKVASEKAMRCLFVKDLDKYTKGIYIPEIDNKKKANGAADVPKKPVAPVAPLPVAPPLVHLKMLEKGDFVPLFEITDTDRKTRPLEVYGGQHCMLFFLPANDAVYVRNFFAQLQQRFGEAKHKNVWQLFILDGTVNELIALKQTIGTQHALWADTDRKLARAFGLCQAGDNATPAAGYVLSNNLRIVSRHINLSAAQLAAAVVKDCQAALAHDPAMHREQRIISEMAPALIVPGAFTPELSKKCIDAFHAGHQYDGTVGAGSQAGYRPNAKVRTDHIITGPLLDEIDEKFSRSVFPEIKKIFGLNVAYRELYKVGLYKGDKGGFFKAHRDNFDTPLGYRRVAMTLHLNDGYEGGGLRFPEYDEHVYCPAAHSAIVFSCSTLHEARPVTKGERYILVCFFHGEEEEAFRRHYLAGNGSPLKIKDYETKLRPEPEIAQSRDYFKEWQSENVSYEKTNAPLLQLPVMVNTIGNHKAKKMFESKQGVIFDDFLPEDVYQKVRDLAARAQYEYNNAVNIQRVQEGLALRGASLSYYTDAAAKTGHAYPSNTDFDLFIQHMLAIQPQVQDETGKAGVDWRHFSLTPWLHPAGAGLVPQYGTQGTYAYFLNAQWRLHWGGLLLLMEKEGNLSEEMLVEHGLAKCIFPKKNRIVFIAKDAAYMITRVNESAGDNMRMSLAGAFNKG